MDMKKLNILAEKCGSGWFIVPDEQDRFFILRRDAWKVQEQVCDKFETVSFFKQFRKDASR